MSHLPDTIVIEKDNSNTVTHIFAELRNRSQHDRVSFVGQVVDVSAPKIYV